ncbi:zinc finger protein 771-like [Myripristis murdjan]|uniref:Zinc finger protein 771-like n=1 Tax=Myripristis murdjan TaxID=586833 RepID=A0A667XJ58_9TELE|nr:zinc finger protein 771-like [Myripristis murdjan]
MSTIQVLRAFVSQRLSAAVEDIFGLLETTITEYEEEIERQRRLLEDVVQPEIRIHKADLPPDVRQLIVSKEEVNQEAVHIKEEEEEVWTNQEAEQLQDLTKFPFTAVPVKSEDDEEEAPPSQLHQSQTEESREAEPVPSTSVKHIKTEEGEGHRQLLSLYCSETETEDSNDDWKEAAEPQAALDSLKKDIVTNHVRSRGGERPFSCTVCDKRFGCKGNLHAHMRSHTGEKPFSCSVCNKCFSAKVNLKTHMRSHTGEKPFSCSVCGKSFSQKKTLVTHVRSHTGERPFSCSFCSKSFSEKGTLKRHIRVHTGEKPYSCSVCGRNFSMRSHVKSHKCSGQSGR